MRRNFSSSGLVRLLGPWAAADAGASRQDFAQRLALWVGVSDAITLDAAHRSIRLLAAAQPAAAAGSASNRAVEEEFLRVRATLVQDITTDAASGAGARRIGNTAAQGGLNIDTGAAFAPYRRRYLERQRQMELRVGALRAHVRQVLSRSSPELAQLATLDAVMDRMLAERAQKLLSTVPVFLERRFEQLRKKAHQAGSPVAPQSPGGPLARPADSWHAVFGREWQQALLAELDDRLQPIVGLIEAFNKVVKKSP